MAHCSTILSQMLKIVPRHVFTTLDKAHGTGRAARKFSRWDQFVHLMSIQLTGRVSLRDGVRSMRSRMTNLYHLGTKPAARSTFAEANEKAAGSLLRGPVRAVSMAAVNPSLPSTSLSSKTSCSPWTRPR